MLATPAIEFFAACEGISSFFKIVLQTPKTTPRVIAFAMEFFLTMPLVPSRKYEITLKHASGK